MRRDGRQQALAGAAFAIVLLAAWLVSAGTAVATHAILELQSSPEPGGNTSGYIDTGYSTPRSRATGAA